MAVSVVTSSVLFALRRQDDKSFESLVQQRS
jgi:hypothetical protein